MLTVLFILQAMPTHHSFKTNQVGIHIRSQVTIAVSGINDL